MRRQPRGLSGIGFPTVTLPRGLPWLLNLISRPTPNSDNGNRRHHISTSIISILLLHPSKPTRRAGLRTPRQEPQGISITSARRVAGVGIPSGHPWWIRRLIQKILRSSRPLKAPDLFLTDRSVNRVPAANLTLRPPLITVSGGLLIHRPHLILSLVCPQPG